MGVDEGKYMMMQTVKLNRFCIGMNGGNEYEL